MTYLAFSDRKIHETIATLPPTPEALITALDGRRFNRGSHRRFYISKDRLIEWFRHSSGPGADAHLVEKTPWDFHCIDVYVDLGDLVVHMVRPKDSPHLRRYADRLLVGLLGDLAKAVPRRPYVNVLWS